jgi:hypothetical protein
VTLRRSQRCFEVWNSGVLPPFLIISRHAIVLDLFFSPCGASTRFQVMAFPYGASRSDSLDTPHSIGLLCTGDQPDAETSSWQHTTFIRDRRPCPTAGFLPTIPAKERPQTHALDRAAARIAIVFDYGDKFTFFLARCKSYRAARG